MNGDVLELYSFFNSSTAFRVRIALALKGLPATLIPVNLRAGAQHGEAFDAVNPAHLVPVLQHGELRITQSLAIIDHLDRIAPTPLLVPPSGPARTRVLEAAMAVATDMHPLNNLRTQEFLRKTFGLSQEQVRTWTAHWWTTGFEALESLLPSGTLWAMGDEGPSLVDCCLVPQVANAERAGFDLHRYPRIRRTYRHCMSVPAFQMAAPDAQPDHVPAR